MSGQTSLERLAAYLHLIADASCADAVRGPGAGPQVGEALDGQRVSAVAVPRHLEVQVAVVWEHNV